MSGTIEVRRPRGWGLKERFESRILPLFMRRTKAVTELLPELQGDFELALRGLLGDRAPLSASSVARLRVGKRSSRLGKSDAWTIVRWSTPGRTASTSRLGWRKTRQRLLVVPRHHERRTEGGAGGPSRPS